MQFLCLICADRTMEQLSDAEALKTRDDYTAFHRDLVASGHYVGSNRLLPPATATTVRVRGGRIVATDGPFTETKEQLGGYYVIEARDLNEAILLASRIPSAAEGCVEVRPIADDARTRAIQGRALTRTDMEK